MLNVSERFMSIQAEGNTVGCPAYFIRLQGCNLMCGGPGGSLVKEGKATWWCDSETIWKRGNPTSFEEIEKDWIEQKLLEPILAGIVHIIWTGGEPTIPRHQKAIMEFCDKLSEKYKDRNFSYHEIETNGTIKVSDIFYQTYIDQINCSAKLQNSGMVESMRINPEAIEQVKKHPEGYFKFVISTEDDVKEIEETYIKKFDIDPRMVIIMPGVDNRAQLAERTAFLFEMTKKYGYRGITRQHILAYDKLTGV